MIHEVKGWVFDMAWDFIIVLRSSSECVPRTVVFTGYLFHWHCFNTAARDKDFNMMDGPPNAAAADPV